MTESLTSVLHAAIPDIPFAWLRERRWFSSKGQTLGSLSVADWGALPQPQPGIMAIVVARDTNGRAEQYLLPLLASTEAEAGKVRVPAATTIVDSGVTWYVHDAFQFESFQRLLMELLIRGDELPLQQGRMIFAPEPRLRRSPPPLQQIHLVTAEQSNNSIVYDGAVILKCFRRVVAGLNPDVEISRFLTTRAGFRHTPALLGSIAYFSGDGVEHSIGVLQEFTPNKGDAWAHTLEGLTAFLSATRQVDAASLDDVLAETQRLAASQLNGIQQLGVVTGELHLALASDDEDAAFALRPLPPEHISHWQASIHEQSEAVLNDLAQRAGGLPAQQKEAVAALLAKRPRISCRIAELSTLAQSDMKLTRYHGDYHLGQVLVTEQGFLILDFEGEPLRSLDERRAHGSPLKDVAGMLRSLSYAAQTVLIANPVGTAVEGTRSDHQPGLAGWLSAWEQRARDAFVSGYLQVARGAPFLPRQSELLHTAIAVFELEKALYELNYELNNRPGWLLIPLRGILRTI